ncbi:MAG TPA: hypothetical protein VM536_12270, partial [Chloroflexia bacterium]|nr:hypothetical protein [Chloroflexia bacterium]
MKAVHMAPGVREQPDRRAAREGWAQMRRRGEASLSGSLSLHLHWVLVLVPLVSYLAAPSQPAMGLLTLVITGYITILYILAARDQQMPAAVVAFADCVFISVMVALRGGPSEGDQLYALPIVDLGLRYRWRGAVAALSLSSVSYALTLYLTSRSVLTEAPLGRSSDLLLRALYLLATAAIISVIAAQQQRTQRTMEQMHARASEQVRRLEA